MNTILKGAHPGTIPVRFGLIWFSGFRGDLNAKVYDVRWTDDDRRQTPSDGKSSHGLWPGELKMTKTQAIVNKTLHIKLKTEQHEPH